MAAEKDDMDDGAGGSEMTEMTTGRGELLLLAPPGVDELMAVCGFSSQSVLRLIETGERVPAARVEEERTDRMRIPVAASADRDGYGSCINLMYRIQRAIDQNRPLYHLDTN